MNEPYCVHCRKGPFSGETGLRIHTTAMHGDEVEPEAVPSQYCCSGRVGYTAHGRPYCMDCGVLDEELEAYQI